MLQRIIKFFSGKDKDKSKKEIGKKNQSVWAAKQLRGMGKLGGKLILM